jgi:hypothetical protein
MVKKYRTTLPKVFLSNLNELVGQTKNKHLPCGAKADRQSIMGYDGIADCGVLSICLL